MAGSALRFDLATVPTLRALATATEAGAPLVVAQLGQSLDGRIATASGHSHYINGRGALTLLHALRAAVDAVVVGAGTARADDPRLTVRHVQGRDPARVLIDRRRSAGGAVKLLEADGTRRIVFGPPLASDPPDLECVEMPGEVLSPAAIVAALSERGLNRVLVEGGATTVSRFLAAAALDRICVLVAPLIIGSGVAGFTLPPVDRLEGAIRPAADVVVLPDGDVLFDCDLR